MATRREKSYSEHISARSLGRKARDLLNPGVLAASIVISLVLTVVGRHTYDAIQSSVRERLGEWLVSVQDAELNKVEVWFLSKRPAVMRAASHAELERLAGELLARHAREEASRKALLEAPELGELRRLLGPLGAQEGAAGFVLSDAAGRILAANENDYIGTVLTARHKLYQRDGFRGRSVVGEALEREQPRGRVRSELLIGAAVRDAEGQPVALLSFRFHPDASIAPLLAGARSLQSGVTVMFDSGGFIISEGGRVVRRAAWLAQALHGAEQQGLRLRPYVNHSGTAVVGAWRWLPDYHIGLLTEVESAAAYRSLTVLQRAFGLLFGLLVVTALGIMLVSYTLILVRRRAKVMLMKARQLGQYTLEDLIGRGGMGEVYKARHQLLRRPTAVKLIHSDRVSEKRLALFEREVQLTSMLTHPNTIAIYDYGRTADNIFYYVMEYLSGITLRHLVKRYGAQEPARVIHILLGVCGSLEEAHGVGLVHRDIKPANVMLCEIGGLQDVVKVLDFGLVKELKEGDDDDLLAGTLRYSAPEVLQPPHAFDMRSDIYSLGAVGYYLLSAGYVFEADDDDEYYRLLCSGGPRPPSARLGRPIPEDLESLVLSCLEREPERRPPTIREVAARLRSCRDAGAWPRERAEAWWKEFQPVLSANDFPAAAEKSGSRARRRKVKTLEVDLSETK